MGQTSRDLWFPEVCLLFAQSITISNAIFINLGAFLYFSNPQTLELICHSSDVFTGNEIIPFPTDIVTVNILEAFFTYGK